MSLGVYRGIIKVGSENTDYQSISIILNVKNEQIENRGYNDLSRLARLNWLNSTMGMIPKSLNRLCRFNMKKIGFKS